MITAREAFELTSKVINEKISDEHVNIIQTKIADAIKNGKSECSISKEAFGLDGIPKEMRLFETYLRSKGYRVEVGYGNGSIKIGWM
jgi:hypothetical protein